MALPSYRGTDPVIVETDVSMAELAKRFHADKGPFDPETKFGHGYTEHYERELAPWRDPPYAGAPRPGVEGKTLLEIGIWQGASMRVFSRWLGAHWTIVGLDLQLYREAMPPPDARTWYYAGNARDRELCRELGEERGPFQVVIDDGSHEAGDQIRAFENFWPFVAPGGIYVIEDLHANYWGGEPFTRECLDFLSGLVDDCHGRGKWATWSGVLLGTPAGRELEVRSVRFYRNMAIVEKYVKPPVLDRVFVNTGALGMGPPGPRTGTLLNGHEEE